MPGEEQLINFMHAGVFIRSRAVRQFTLDGRVQVALAEMGGCSGCLLDGMAAVSVGAFWGGRRLESVRPVSVLSDSHGTTDFVVSLRPLSIVWTHRL